jgi:ubiquinol-cytochrome c reductase cytochrome c1 subunit
MSKKTIVAALLSVVPLVAGAAGGAHAPLQDAGNDLTDQASLQRGARLFVNYCLSCHPASYMRYNRMGKDLGLSEDQVRENLMFAGDKVGEPMRVAMRSKDGSEWFGQAPPDLTLVARSRGTDWLYSYLIGFYDDSSRPWGVNNLVFPQVGMPHVLWELQGRQAPVYAEVKQADGTTTRKIERLELVQEGKMNEAAYQGAMRDLVNFLEYMSEPVKLERQRLGVWVILFLLVFFALAYALKKEYWKDLH